MMAGEQGRPREEQQPAEVQPADEQQLAEENSQQRIHQSLAPHNMYVVLAALALVTSSGFFVHRGRQRGWRISRHQSSSLAAGGNPLPQSRQTYIETGINH